MTPDGPMMLATDGRMAVAVPLAVVEGELAEPAGVPTELADAAGKVSDRECRLGLERHLSVNGGPVVLEDRKGETVLATRSASSVTQERYPDPYPCRPTGPVTRTVSFNATYLAAIARAMGVESVRLELRDPSGIHTPLSGPRDRWPGEDGETPPIMVRPQQEGVSDARWGMLMPITVAGAPDVAESAAADVRRTIKDVLVAALAKDAEGLRSMVRTLEARL